MLMSKASCEVWVWLWMETKLIETKLRGFMIWEMNSNEAALQGQVYFEEWSKTKQFLKIWQDKVDGKYSKWKSNKSETDWNSNNFFLPKKVLCKLCTISEPLAKFSCNFQQVLRNTVFTPDNDGFYSATHVPGRFKTGHLTGWKFSSWEIFRQLFCSTRRLLKSNYISSGKSEAIRGL